MACAEWYESCTRVGQGLGMFPGGRAVPGVCPHAPLPPVAAHAVRPGGPAAIRFAPSLRRRLSLVAAACRHATKGSRSRPCQRTAHLSRPIGPPLWHRARSGEPRLKTPKRRRRAGDRPYRPDALDHLDRLDPLASPCSADLREGNQGEHLDHPSGMGRLDLLCCSRGAAPRTRSRRPASPSAPLGPPSPASE